MPGKILDRPPRVWQDKLKDLESAMQSLPRFDMPIRHHTTPRNCPPRHESTTRVSSAEAGASKPGLDRGPELKQSGLRTEGSDVEVVRKL